MKAVTRGFNLNLEDMAPIVMILIAVGVLFGTFSEFSKPATMIVGDKVVSIPKFGFAWFTDMLWFVIGFIVLFVVAELLYTAATKGQMKLESKST